MLLPGWLWAQEEVRLGEERFVPEQNIVRTRGHKQLLRNFSTNGSHNILVQLSSLPKAGDLEQLREQGLVLQDYLGGNAYFALLRKEASSLGRLVELRSGAVRLTSVMDLRPEWKMSKAMAEGKAPQWARRGRKVKVTLRYAANARETEVAAALKRIGMEDIHIAKGFRTASGALPLEKRVAVAALPYVLSLQFAAPPARLENWTGRLLSRAELLARPAQYGGRGLTGKGIRVGMWDANVDHHPDFGKRIHSMESAMADPHGTHVAGIIMGAGLVSPHAEGMAKEVEIYSWNFNTQANGLHEPEEMQLTADKYGITLTSNSYGPSFREACWEYGNLIYRLIDNDLDKLSTSHPELLHVFAAGNEQQSCEWYTKDQWGTAGYGTSAKRGKNVVYVGAVSETGEMTEFSSWGPQDDGRMFPTLCAKGQDVYSTLPSASYGDKSGTSMACPTATGTFALLSERFAQLHSGKPIPGALLKAVAANTAQDAGRPHCDFQYGYGILDGEQAAIALEREQYKLDLSVENTKESTLQIPVPEGVKEVRVMLYWADPVSDKQFAYGESVMTNDLDLVVTAGATEYKPWVCNATKGKVEEPATRSEDKLNNMEQVTLSAAELNGVGSLTAKVTGSKVTAGKQGFLLTWCYIMEDDLRVVAPCGLEQYMPGEIVMLQVSGLSEKAGSRSYSAEISYDGTSYQSLELQSGDPGYDWGSARFAIPENAPTTAQAYVRVLDANGRVATSPQPFTIAPVPTNLDLTVPPCAPGGWKLSWQPVKDAGKGYVVLRINPADGSVTPVGTVGKDTHEYTIPAEALKNAERTYFSVAVALEDGKRGRYAEAQRANAAPPVVLSKASPYFNDYFVETPSPKFRIETGEKINPIYVDNDEGAVAGAHILGLLVMGNAPKSFNRKNYFADENKAFRATISLCDVDLSALPASEYAYFHISTSFRNPRSDAQFRVLDGSDVLVDQFGGALNTPQTGGLPKLNGLRDFYYKLQGGKKHSLRFEFSSPEENSLIGFDQIGVQLQEQQGFLALDQYLFPKSGANLGQEKILLAFSNKNSQAVKNVDVRILVNGELAYEDHVPQIGGFQSAILPCDVDLSTAKPLGEKKDIRVEARVRDAKGIAPVKVEQTVLNLGDVLPMATSYEQNTAAGMKMINPNEIVRLEKPAIFTDNGGAIGNYTVYQDVTMKILPPSPEWRVQVTFKELQLEDGKAQLSVFPQTIAGTGLDIYGKKGIYLPSTLSESMTITSQADDGALTFYFKSDVDGTAKAGWIADVRFVPNQNTLTMLSCSAVVKSETKVKIPIHYSFRNNWKETISKVNLKIYTVYSPTFRSLLYSEELKDIPSGVYEGEVPDKLSQSLGESKMIAVAVECESDLDKSDNEAQTRALVDRYCTTDKLIEDEDKPYIAEIITSKGKNSLGKVGRYNFYKTWESMIFGEPTETQILFTFGAKTPMPMQLTAWIDWNDDGDFADSEKVTQAVAAGVEQEKLSLNIAGKSGKHRMRILFCPADVSASPCVDAALYGSMYDLPLEIKAGANPKIGDLEVKDVQIGNAGIATEPELPVTFRILNKVKDFVQPPYTGTLTAEVLVDGVKSFEEEVNCSTTPIPLEGAIEVTLKKKLPIPAEGAHRVEVKLVVPNDPKENNNKKGHQLLVPSKRLFALSLKYPAEIIEYVSVGTAGILMKEAAVKTKEVTFETWVKMESYKEGALFLANGLQILVLADQAPPRTNHSFGVKVGDKMLLWSPENSLPLHQWTHVAVTLSNIVEAAGGVEPSCEVNMFINGEKVTLEREGMDAPDFENIRGGYQLNGMLKGMRLWSKARTAEQIEQGMLKVQARDEDCLGAYPVLAGYGSTILYSTQDFYNAPLVCDYQRPNPTDNTGIWVEDNTLVADFSFEGQTLSEKTGDNAYTIHFAHTMDGKLTNVTGKVIAAWAKGMTIKYQGQPITDATVYDFTKDVVLKAEATLFGQSYEQTVTLKSAIDKSSDCQLFSLTLEQAKNAGLTQDVAAQIAGSNLLVRIPTGSGSISNLDEVVLSFTHSPKSTVSVNGATIQSGTNKVSLGKALVITVTAEDGVHSQQYVLNLVREQTVTLSVTPTSVTLGDAPGEVTASASSNRSIFYTSSNANVATIANGKLYCSEAGEATLLAQQAGGDGWLSAKSTEVKVTVGRAQLAITPAIVEVKHGDLPVWNFTYETLLSPADKFTIPMEELISAFEIKDQSDKVCDPTTILPKGTYRVVPKAGAAIGHSRYTISLQEGTFKVVEGALHTLSIKVLDMEGNPLSGIEVQLDLERRTSNVEGLVTWLLPDNAEYEFELAGKGYQAQRAKVKMLAEDQSITVQLEKTAYTITYKAKGAGFISGQEECKVQVAKGADAKPVVAQPGRYYVFMGWSDGSKTPKRQDLCVMADAEYTALFERPKYTLTYSVTAGGKIVAGDKEQQVPRGANAQAVTVAPADEEHYFTGWNDGEPEKSRQERQVTESAEFVANFASYAPLPSQTDFESGLSDGWHFSSKGRSYCPWRMVTQDTEDNILKSKAPMANADEIGIGADVNTALISPRYLVKGANEAVTIVFTYGYKMANDTFTLEYQTDGGEWQPIQVLPEGYPSLTVRYTLEKEKIEGKKYLQFRWRYNTKWTFFAWVDDVTVFLEKPAAAPVTVTYSASPSSSATFTVQGKTVGSQTVSEGEIPKPVCVVTAAGYRFAQWKNGAKSNPYAPALPIFRNEEMVAELVPENEIELRYTVFPEGAGVIKRGDRELVSEKLTKGQSSEEFVAVANPGYVFLRWADNGSTVARRSITPTENQTIQAVYARQTTLLLLSVLCENQPVENADINIGGQYAQTDSKGLATVKIPAGEYTLMVSAQGPYSAYSKQIKVEGASMQIEVVLQNEALPALNFIVMHREKPVAGAKVTVGSTTRITSPQGFAQFHLQPGEYDYSVQHTETVPVKASATLVEGEKNTVLVALRGRYQVKFNFNDASGTVAIQEVLEGDLAKEPSKLQLEGKTFKGWYLDGQIYNFSTPVERSITLVAEWKDREEKPTAISLAEESSLRVVPNPVKNALRIEGLTQPATVELLSLTGGRIRTLRVAPGESISTRDLSTGVYILRIGSRTIRFVKQ